MNFNTSARIMAIGLALTATALAFGQTPPARRAAVAAQSAAAPQNLPSIDLVEPAPLLPSSTAVLSVNGDDILLTSGSQPPRSAVDPWVGNLSGGDRALIVRSTETDPKTLAAMEEDLNIMGRILEKSVRITESGQNSEAMGLPLVTIGGNMRSTQIEGYGVLYQLTVGFPLRGTVEKPDDITAKPPPDSPWEQTRRELQGRTDPLSAPGGMPESAQRLRKNPFDPKRVDQLKNSLLEALKNASNMSHIKPDESIAVLVQSSARSFLTLTRAVPVEAAPAKPPTDSADAKRKWEAVDNYATKQRVSAIRSGWNTGASGAVLSIRAKKSDIDAFANGKLNLEEFRKKAAILIY
jgi:hypothetical protein